VRTSPNPRYAPAPMRPGRAEIHTGCVREEES